MNGWKIKIGPVSTHSHTCTG